MPLRLAEQPLHVDWFVGRRLIPLLTLAIGCGEGGCQGGEGQTIDTGAHTSGPVDLDNDGANADEDCDDTDPEINPQATELCDGVDNDCDGSIDEDDAADASTWYIDGDGDGYGNEAAWQIACDAPEGQVSLGGDCDDEVEGTNPGATEHCGDGIDNDCDGTANDCELSGEIELSGADATIEGEASYDEAGWSVAAAGDVNGDGRADLLIGAPGGELGGVAYLLLGSVSGTVELSAAHARLLGEGERDSVGRSLGTAGDLNGDGFDDFLVAAYDSDQGGDGAGAVYVVHGPVSGSPSLGEASALLLGESPSGAAGSSIAGGGDLTGDSILDVLVGASGDDTAGTNAGAIYAVQGPITGTIGLSEARAKVVGEEISDQLGDSIAWAGDTDGDGVGDLVVGATGQDRGGDRAGAAYLIIGPVSGTISVAEADAILVGALAGGRAGTSVASAGDMNGDGLDDVLVGAPDRTGNTDQPGHVYLVHGPISGTLDLALADAILAAGDQPDGAGQSVSGGGDLDGDGNLDVLVGAPVSGDGGAAYIAFGPLSGAVDLSNAGARLADDSKDTYAGYSVAIAGDVNDDEIDDLVIGGPFFDVPRADAGVAWLFFGSGL